MRKKMATSTFTYNALRAKPQFKKTERMKTQRKIVSSTRHECINTSSLNSDLDGHLSKVNLDNYNAHPRSDRSKASCDIL